MQDDRKTLKDYLIEIGLWREEDGVLGTDDSSWGIILERVQQSFSPGVFLMFYGTDDTKHEARVIWEGKQQTLASGKNMADTICLAAVSLPGFFKEYPKCAARIEGN